MLPEAFPQHVVIVGGGSAGWMAAAYLDRSFNLPERRRLKITLVESPQIGRIGVGEATIPSIVEFSRFIGIDEATLMNRTGATFKHGVRFLDWAEPGSDYFHPFEAIEAFNGLNPAPSWLARKAAGAAGTFDDESSVQRAVAVAGRAPKRMTDPDYHGVLPYAYHLDAEAYGDLLSEVAKERGVAHVQGRVAQVLRDEAGDVSELILDDGRSIVGDFFIDCSGFASILLEKALGTPFESFGDYLLCDRAVAIPTPYRMGSQPLPYTSATALSAGWMWRIGLQHREGLGHVYSSQFTTPEAAEAELRERAGLDHSLPARHLEMRVGMPQVSWNRNVVSLGLAGGFIEPLESTGLHMVELALGLLVRYFPLSGMNSAARDRFNAMMRERYLELRDFIVGHYCLSRRVDTDFWREVQKEERIPPTVRAKLALWNDRHPSADDNDHSKLIFAHSSWQALIYGMGYVTDAATANAARWCPQPGIHLQSLQQAKATLLADLPMQSIWLDGLRTIEHRRAV